MSTALIYHDQFLEHDTGSGHPERPDRLRAIVEHLKQTGRWERLEHLPFEACDRQRVLRLHDQAYVDRLNDACIAHRPYIDTADSAISRDSEAIARLAVGGVLRAVDAVMAGEVSNAFCALRPPGHHAEADRSMGFCLYANAALAAESLIADHGLERVAIVDFDVHHGNGTQHLLENRSDVLFISLHQDPRTCYPGTGTASETGRGVGEGFTLNLPLLAGSGDDAMLAALEQSVLPRLAAFAPQFLLISAGFDAAAADPLAELNWSNEGYATLSRRLLEATRNATAGRVVSVLEGGYDLTALRKGVGVHIDALLSAGT